MQCCASSIVSYLIVGNDENENNDEVVNTAGLYDLFVSGRFVKQE